MIGEGISGVVGVVMRGMVGAPDGGVAGWAVGRVVSGEVNGKGR